MTKIEVRLLTKTEYDQWDRLVEQSPWGTIFHSSKWITTSAKSLHLEYVIIGVFKDSHLIGGCSFFIKKIFLFFKFGYTDIPLTPLGGFVISIPESTKVSQNEKRMLEIFSLIFNKIQNLNLTYIKVTSSPAIIDIRPFKFQYWKEEVNYAYVLDLNKDILSSVTYNIRRNIIKAHKTGINVEREFNPDIFWKLIQMTYDKQNMEIPFQKEHFYNLMDMLIQNNLGEMWIAKNPLGDAASAVFIIYDSHMAYGWVGANDPRYIDTGIVSLLLFEIFKDLQRRGFQKINLWAGNTPHLTNFYSRFNPQLIPYYSVQKSRGVVHILNIIRSIFYRG